MAPPTKQQRPKQSREEEEEEEDAVDRPEVLINRYVRLLAATANITSGFGTLALLWSTVVLLGGFVTVVRIKEFWVLTVLSFLMALRVVDNYDNEFKRGIYTEEKAIIKFIKRQEFMDVASAQFQRIMLGMVFVPKYILLTCLALLSFNVFPFVSLGISVWRLVRRDYGDVGGDIANTAKLNAALNIFYALVLFQSLLVIYWVVLDVILVLPVSQVAVATSKQFGDEKWIEKLVDMYRSETRRKFRKDGELPDNWNLVTYGVELLQSASASGDDDHRWGARVLDKLSVKDHKSVRQELLSSRLSVQNLIGMIGQRGAGDNIEKRERAARIIAHLASDLHITQFPGALQCICSVLESSCEPQPQIACPSENPVEQTLTHKDDQHGSLQTSKHHDMVVSIKDQTNDEQVIVSSSSSGLAKSERTTLHQLKKELTNVVITLWQTRVARKYSEREYRHSYKPRGAKELISQGLLILERLTQDEGNCTEIMKHPWLLSKITSPLSSQDLLSSVRGNRMVEMLSRSLTVVSRLLTSPGDGAARLRQEMASNMEAVSNLMGILVTYSQGAQKLHEQVLEILTELAFDDSFKIQDFNKLFKALLRIFLEEEADNTIVEEATRLRGKAGEALARLPPLRLRAARHILSEQKAINVLTKVLNEIVLKKIGTNADADTGAGGSQPLEEPSAQKNEKQSAEERKFMAAVLSLAAVICNEIVISEEDFARAIRPIPEDAVLAKKLKEILEANKHSTAEHLRIVKLTCQVAIALIQMKPSCITHFNEHSFKEALAEAFETMSEVDDCMLFDGNGCGVVKPARSLASLVKEAQELLTTGQQQGNECL